MRIIRFLQVNFAVVWKNSESMDICFNPERSWIRKRLGNVWERGSICVSKKFDFFLVKI